MAFLVLIDGSEYVAATDGVASMPTSTDSAWPSDISSMTLLQGALVTPRGTISERAKPLDGDLDVSGMTFRFRDLTPSAGGASGSPWLTKLASTRFSNITQTQLAATLSSTGTTITVDDNTSFAASGTLYIDRETITYSAKPTSTTFTVTSRHCYGSLATQHVVNSTYSFKPIVWAAWPGMEGRRITLFYVNGSNVATALWIGVVKNGPRLLDGDAPEAGAQWEIQCEHIWNYERELKLGVQGASCHLIGFNAGYIQASTRWPGGSTSQTVSGFDSTARQPSVEDALGLIQSKLNTAYGTAGVSLTSQLSYNDGAAVHRVQATGVGGPVFASIAKKYEAVNMAPSTESADPRTATAISSNFPTTVVCAQAWFPNTYLVDTVAGLPASWGPTSAGDATYITTTQYVLTGMMSGDTRLVIEPSASSSTPTSITGQLRLISTATGRDILDPRERFADRVYWIADPPTLRVTARITATRWLDVIRYGITTTTDAVNPVSSVDSRNWDWTTHGARILALTESSASSRVLYLDGTRSVGDIIGDQFKFQGVGLGVRNGRVQPMVFLPPAQTDTITALTSADLLSKSSWGRNPDGIVNTVEVETDYGTVVVNEQTSIARFGQGRSVKMKLVGSDDRRLADPDPLRIMQDVLHRVMNLWSEPTYVRKVRVSISKMLSLYIGDYVSLTEWLTPDGSGGRGPTTSTAQVIGKTINLGDRPSVELELLEYGQQYIYGYAPCATVTSIAGGVLTIANNLGTLGNSTIADYSGSSLSSYTGTANDGGASKFQTGDRVKLVKRNVTTVTEETGFTIQSVSPSGTPLASTITVSPNPATVVGTDWWDVTFDNYGNGSNPTAYEKKFAWVGSYSTRVIGTSTDAANRWAP